jgi:HK97 family phage portal protein
MRFWQTLTAPLRKSASPDWGVLERYLGWAFGGGVSASGVIVNPANAMQSAAVYACVKVLAESVGMLPFNLFKEAANGDKTAAKEHPLYELLRWQPNDYQTSVEFWEMVVMHLCMRGNAYAWINRTKSGRVVEMIPLHPDMVNVTMGSDTVVTYQAGTESGGMRVVPRDQILHIKGLTLNGWLGISPIAYARESIGLALATEKFGGQLFRNGAKMGGILETPGKLSDAAYTRLRGSFDAATSGENAHKTALLEEGTKFTKIAMSSDDAQFLETRKYQRSEIAGIFRVPPHKIGDLEKATFGNIEEQNIQFATDGVQPLVTRIEAAIRRDVFTRDDKKAPLCLKADMSVLLRGNAESRAKFYAAGITNGWMLRSEARRMEDLNSIAGLDIPLMPLNMTDGREPPVQTPAPGAAQPLTTTQQGASQ